jgi:tetratricopeptide (TPR) repeat protein
MGQTYRLRGDFEPALGFFKKYLRIVEKINNQTAIVQAFNNIGLIYWHTGKFRDANDHFSRCLDIAQRIGYKSVLSTIYGNIGLIYNEIDKARTAIRYFHEAIKSGEEVGNKASVANNMNNAALCYAGAYDTGNALKYFNHSLSIFKKINNPFGIALLLNNIATIHFNNGDFQKALMHEKESEAMAKSGKMTEMIVRTWTLKARIYAAWNRHAQSMEAFKNAIALAERSKMENLKMTAVIHCVNALIKEKNLKRLAAMSKYIIHLENSLKKESDNYYRSLVLCTLARFDLLENRNGEARKKLAILSAILKRSKDKRFIAETLIMRARLNIADGKKHAHLIMRARELAKKTGLYYLAVEIRQVVKSSKNSEESL